MKKYLIILSLFPNLLYGILRVGLNAGLDFFNIKEDSITIKLKDGNDVFFYRSKISNPLAIGILTNFTGIPIIEIEGGLSFSLFKKYKYRCDVLTPSSGELTFNRIVGFAGVTKNIVEFPPMPASIFKLYVGGGISTVFESPILDSSLIYDNIPSKDELKKPGDLLKSKIKFAPYIVLGMRIAEEPLLFISLNIQIKYYFLLKKNKTGSYPHINLGLYTKIL